MNNCPFLRQTVPSISNPLPVTESNHFYINRSSNNNNNQLIIITGHTSFGTPTVDPMLNRSSPKPAAAGEPPKPPPSMGEPPPNVGPPPIYMYKYSIIIIIN